MTPLAGQPTASDNVCIAATLHASNTPSPLSFHRHISGDCAASVDTSHIFVFPSSPGGLGVPPVRRLEEQHASQASR